MLMPKAAVDEDGAAARRKNDVRFSWQIHHVLPETETREVQQRSQPALRLRLSAANGAHRATPRLRNILK
jgi:hypothetical protein